MESNRIATAQNGPGCGLGGTSTEEGRCRRRAAARETRQSAEPSRRVESLQCILCVCRVCVGHSVAVVLVFSVDVHSVAPDAGCYRISGGCDCLCGVVVCVTYSLFWRPVSMLCAAAAVDVIAAVGRAGWVAPSASATGISSVCDHSWVCEHSTLTAVLPSYLSREQRDSHLYLFHGGLEALSAVAHPVAGPAMGPVFAGLRIERG